MELAARIGTMARRGAPLPYDKEVEWIHGVIGPYINTGYVINQKSRINVSLSYESLPESHNLQAFQNGSTYREYDTGNFRVVLDFQDRDTRIYVGSAEVVKFTTYRIGQIIINYIDCKNRIFKINDTTGRVYSQLSGYYDLPWFLFARNHLGNAQWFCDEKIYYAQFYTDDELVLDLIPVRFTNENGVSEGAMYDRVSGQLFRNQGTGAFIIGPDVVSSRGGGGY